MDGFASIVGVAKAKSRLKRGAQKRSFDDPKVEKIEGIKKKITAAAYTATGQTDFRKLFQKYDKDNSGNIDFNEFLQAVRKDARLTPAEASDGFLKELFEEIDKDGGGEINYEEEFTEWVGYDSVKAEAQLEKNRSIERELTKKILEKRKDAGILRPKHIEQIRQKMKAKAYDSSGLNFDKLYKFYDRNNDGTMDFSEFANAVRKDGEISKTEVADEQLRTLFDQLDKDGGGEISFKDEFLPWLLEGHEEKSQSRRERSKSHISHFHVLRVQASKDENIRFFDMVRRKVNASSYGTEHRSYETVFKKFDKDGNGLIDLDEFNSVLRVTSRMAPSELPRSKVKAIFRQIDADNGGEIGWEEFMEWLQPAQAI